MEKVDNFYSKEILKEKRKLRKRITSLNKKMFNVPKYNNVNIFYIYSENNVEVKKLIKYKLFDYLEDSIPTKSL